MSAERNTTDHVADLRDPCRDARNSQEPGDDFMPVEGVNGFTLKGSPESLVDAALQVYARTFQYPDSRHLHEAAMAYREELIAIVTDYRTLRSL